MSCIQPREQLVISQYTGKQWVKVDCRHCLNCLIKRTSQVEFLAKKELVSNYMKGRSASFVTLTYDDEHLPKNRAGFTTLRREDVQKFIKNMRRQMEYYKVNLPFKYLYCGEYGDGSHSTSKNGVSTSRSHYHIIFIGLSPTQVRKYTRKLWKYGLCDIGPLSAGGIRYLCKYMTKASPTSTVKDLREAAEVQNPFFYHSIGLGKEWIDKNLDKIVEDGFTYNIAGRRQLLPSNVIKYVAYHTATNYKTYVNDFLLKTLHEEAKGHNKTPSEYDYEKSYLKEVYLIAAARSQGKPVDDLIHSRSYIKPFHLLDRNPQSVQSLFEELN